jgi:hypothetical protein
MMDIEKERQRVERTKRPTIAIDAMDAKPADIARTALRAKARDHPVIVYHNGGVGSESLTVAEEAGAFVVDVSESARETRSTLVRMAKAYGFAGMIWHDAPSEPINYEKTVDDFERSERYAVTAAIGSIADDDPESELDVMVAIPAFNEGRTVGTVVAEAEEFADRVLVVDDGSDDDTTRRAEEAGASVVTHRRNQGYGAALQTAFAEADRLGVEHLVVLDGDGQHDPADVAKLVETQRETGAEVVIGNRFHGGSDVPLYRRLGLFVVNVLTNIGLRTFRRASWIRDTQSGFRAYDRDAIRSISRDESIGSQMSASTDIVHHALTENYAIAEVGTTISYDADDPNSQHPLSHGVDLVRNILTLVEQERPILFIGVPGFAATFVGFGLAYVALTNLLHTGEFPVGTAVTSVFFALAGGLACFSAVILHSIEVHLGEKR